MNLPTTNANAFMAFLGFFVLISFFALSIKAFHVMNKEMENMDRQGRIVFNQRAIQDIQIQLNSLKNPGEDIEDLTSYKEFSPETPLLVKIEDLENIAARFEKNLSISMELPELHISTWESMIVEAMENPWLLILWCGIGTYIFLRFSTLWAKESKNRESLNLRLTEQAEANKNLALKQTEKVELEIKKLKQPSFHIRK
jgi:hypothetical protein